VKDLVLNSCWRKGECKRETKRKLPNLHLKLSFPKSRLKAIGLGWLGFSRIFSIQVSHYLLNFLSPELILGIKNACSSFRWPPNAEEKKTKEYSKITQTSYEKRQWT